MDNIFFGESNYFLILKGSDFSEKIEKFHIGGVKLQPVLFHPENLICTYFYGNKTISNPRTISIIV